MKVNLEDLKETQKKIDVYIPSDVVESKRSSIFNEFKRNANIKGFRRGKAPNHVIESMYGKSIKQEIVSELISETFEDALKEVELSLINKPDVTPDEIEKDTEFHYSAVFEIIPKFEISEYKGLELKKGKIEVKKADIDKTLTDLRERSAQSKLVEEDRKVKKGDVVIIDFEGKIDGETVKDLKQENARFIVGEGHLIKEFDENILGLKKGKEAKFDIKYEEDFQIKEAAGKTVNYVLKLNEIHERIVPKANAEFAKEMGFETLKELKERIKEDLTAQLERTEQTKLKEQIVDIFDKKTKIEIPESLVRDEEIRLKRDFAANFQRQGIPLPELDEGGDEKFKEIAAKNVKSSIIFAEIAKKENIKPSSKELQDKLSELASSLQIPMDKMMEVYQDKNMLTHLEATITEEKVVEFINEKANVVEELDNKSENKSEIDNDS